MRQRWRTRFGRSMARPTTEGHGLPGPGPRARVVLGWIGAAVVITVVNGTGYGIKFLGFNNPGDNDWSDNELGSVLRNRGSVYVKFNTEDDGCVWNLKIEWADPGYPGVLWNDVDLCKITTLRLRYNRSTDTTSYLARHYRTVPLRSIEVDDACVAFARRRLAGLDHCEVIAGDSAVVLSAALADLTTPLVYLDAH